MILHDAKAAASKRYDAIVVGGGILGVMLTLEAARRGLKPLLLERDDFGQHTSWNSLRIAHGGLRYLQSADLPRFRESVAERRWLLRYFPEQVQPLRCLMPLYGEGLRRPSVLRLALAANDALSRGRNEGIDRTDRHIPNGRVIDAEACVKLAPSVNRSGLRGAAEWYDAVMPCSQRLLVEALRWAVDCGAGALNYCRAEQLIDRDGSVQGVRAIDSRSETELTFEAPVVINSAGPWSPALAARFDRPAPQLFRPSLAINLLFDIEPPFSGMLAVDARRKGAQTYFLCPVGRRLFAGTFHEPWHGEIATTSPGEASIRAFVDALREALPSLPFQLDRVAGVRWGYIPVTREGGVELTPREEILDHASEGGPRGLLSVATIKFTTARAVAQKALRRAWTHRDEPLPGYRSLEPPPARMVPDAGAWRQDRQGALAVLREIADGESVRHLSDLVHRRSDWADESDSLDEAAAELARLRDWDASRLAEELRGCR